MGIALFNILFCAAGFVFIISAFIFLTGVFAHMFARKGKGRIRKRCLILMLISGCLTAYALPRAVGGTTTIGQFSDEIAAVGDLSPTALFYTESIGAPGSFSTVVEDPAVAAKALDVILRATVDRRGCQMDMNRLMSEEYSFVIGGGSCVFRFVPDSYFCHDGKYYELGENGLAELRALMHGLAADAGTSVEPRPE